MAKKKTEEPEPEATVAEALAEAAVPPKKKPEYLETKEVTVDRGEGPVTVTLGKRFARVNAGGLDFMQEVWDELDEKPAKPIRAPVVEEPAG